ncbi:MAG: EAL domain-containing protein, partial [Coriobacteriaceae bacterium]|nr:EAL domain-containing protein [Coriobacteriaceae bacterium]
GYSSLARQLEINVNCLKIDKFFVDKLASPLPEKSLVREIISIAKRLGHESIAEGVEYEIQKRYLLDYGCDMIQGYLVSKPLSEQDAMEFLISR